MLKFRMTLTIHSLHSLLDPLVLPYTLPPARPNQHHPPLLINTIYLDITHLHPRPQPTWTCLPLLLATSPLVQAPLVPLHFCSPDRPKRSPPWS